MGERLELRTLGGLNIQRGGVPVTGFDSRKVAALLIYLACTGRTFPREVLAEMLWEERTQAQALSNLRVALHSLNQTLGDYVEITREAVGLRPDADVWLDIAEFETLLSAAGNDAARLDAALDLYQGDFLAGFFVDSSAYEQWATRERERLRLRVMEGLDRLIGARLVGGEYSAGIAAATRLLEMDPLREETHRQLMELLWHSGQRGKALEQYETCRRLLREELGIDPTSETTTLTERIQRGEQLSTPLLRRTYPISDPSLSEPREPTLPIQPTPFVGRERELAEVQQLLSTARLLTLTGPGGIGKTRLVLQAASELTGSFHDGVFFVPLAPIYDPARVPDTIARTLGVPEQPTTPPLETLKSHLRAKDLLLVLDNFEQIAEAAPQVADLLGAAPYLKVLVTSREALRLSGEQVYEVPPLGVPDPTNVQPPLVLVQYEAVALFVQRAGAVQREFRLTPENGPAVAEICARLDGLPLAIELAATRTRLLSPHAILERLGLDLLTGGTRDAPARQQTLRATMDWSYSLLDEAERALFSRLAVFSGGWTLEAAEAVYLGDKSDVLDGLESLLGKSLLRRSEQPEGEPRFGMLETLREYALERLEASGAAEEARRRHAEYYAQYYTQWWETVDDFDSRGRLSPVTIPALEADVKFWDRVEREQNNLRAGADWALARTEASAACQLAHLLYVICESRGSLQEAEYWLVRAVPLARNQENQLLAHVILSNASWISYQLRHYEAAVAYAREVLDHARAGGELLYECDALMTLGVSLCEVDPAEALAVNTEGLALATRLNYTFLMAVILNNIGVLAQQRGDYVQAREYLERAAGFSRRIGETGSGMEFNLALVELRSGNLDRAWALLDEYWQRVQIWKALRETKDLAVGYAGVAVLYGQASWAARLFGALDAFLEATTSTPDQQEYDHYLALTRALLSEAEFEMTYAEGRSLPLEAVVNQAREALRNEI